MKFIKYKNIIILILLALVIVCCCCFNNKQEGFLNLNTRCPNMLIQNNNLFYLYNSRQVKVPGVNPLVFNNLNEYAQFIKWQKSQGIRCPILYLQETNNTQGVPVYKVRKSPFNLQGGLPDKYINIKNKNVNKNVNKNGNKNGNLSANAMDKNFGGVQYAREEVKKGNYKGDDI
jgi:hypothetical protein